MKHALVRMEEQGRLHGGLWQKTAAHWSFNGRTNRRQVRRNLRKQERREEHMLLAEGLAIFIVQGGNPPPSKAELREVFGTTPTSLSNKAVNRPSYRDIQDLL